MLDTEKVKLMTKLAIYEKNEGKEDIKKTDFFRTDYISYNNFLIQLSVTFALLIIFGIEFTNIVANNLADITKVNFIALGTKYLTIWIIMIVIYTSVSTINGRRAYSQAQKRLDEYEKMLKNLEKIQ